MSVYLIFILDKITTEFKQNKKQVFFGKNTFDK